MAKTKRKHREAHLSGRGGWLRAAVLGADDGVVSTASLMLGVAASAAARSSVLVAGIAGLAAGALSMAAGEYVSVSSQRDAECADIERERAELAADPQSELDELAAIYRRRGLEPELATRVAEQLSAKNDRLEVHMREELGLDRENLARPLQAAIVSAASFASLGVLPIIAMLLAPASLRLEVIAIVSLVALGVLGALGARLGGAPMPRGALRVVAGGGLAMLITSLIGHFLGALA
jgi:VIT1/CCC1 family predicted Fe2+/Mn2+ transporter